MSDLDTADLRERYLRSLRAALIGGSPFYLYWFVPEPAEPALAAHADALRNAGLEVVSARPPVPELQEGGAGWLTTGMSMLGDVRLEQLQRAVETVIDDGIEGDLIETGVWRGGATILMRGVLMAYGVTDRQVWVADSFQGLPPPDPDRYPADAGDRLHTQHLLAVSLDEVRANFAWHGLLDHQVRFLPGWFRNTLPSIAGRRWAVIRLDGDLYESTILGLEHLYPTLSPGGFLIVDDYGAMQPCRQAVEDYRAAHGITEPLTQIDWTAVCWRKS
jgi:O-methyltransferase